MHASANDFSSVNITSLINILQSFKNNPNNYDGVRVYFALSDNRPQTGFDLNTLYLVFVPTMPTTLTDINTDIISDDYETNSFIISINAGATSNSYNFAHVDLNTDRYVKKWINRYVNKAVPRIEFAYRNNYDIKIDETHSLWYSKRVMFYNNPPDGLGPDLLTYLTDHAAVILCNL